VSLVVGELREQCNASSHTLYIQNVLLVDNRTLKHEARPIMKDPLA
jgi:hypothetical protein